MIRDQECLLSTNSKKPKWQGEKTTAIMSLKTTLSLWLLISHPLKKLKILAENVLALLNSYARLESMFKAQRIILSLLRYSKVYLC